MLPVRVSRRDQLRDWPTLTLAQVQATKSVLITPDRRKHVVVQQRGVSLHLESRDIGLFRKDAFLVAELQVSPLSNRLVDTFWAIVGYLRTGQQSSQSNALLEPYGQSHRLCDYLVALDGWQAGKRRRDIAVDLFGADRVEAEWSDPNRNLVENVRYRIRRGLELSKGGYRKLLK